MLALAMVAAAACHAGTVADRSCTPGSHFHASAKQVCVSGWSKRHRHVMTAQRRIRGVYHSVSEKHLQDTSMSTSGGTTTARRPARNSRRYFLSTSHKGSVARD